MIFHQGSPRYARFQAALTKVCFLIGMCPKICSKYLPKPSKIHPESDPGPYQKIDDFLEGPPGGIDRKSTIPLHQIWSEKGEEMERDCLKRRHLS